MIINMTTFAGRAKHYIGQTLESLFQSDGRDIPVNLILGSRDTSHVEQYRNVANIIPWDQEAESQARKGKLRHNCNVNAIRALKYGADDYCLCCEDDIIFDKSWLSQLMMTIDQIDGKDYVLNLGQKSDQSLDKRYAIHSQPYLCGAQAIFYPSKQLRNAVADYLVQNITKGTNDTLIGRYGKRHAALYNTCPVLVRHAGMVSSFTRSKVRSAPRFSIVVLARNEEWALPRLLYDLDDFIERGGEVLVADTGSTDGTVAIARNHGCRVELMGDTFDTVLDAEEVAEIERCIAKANDGPLVTAGQRLFHFGDARQHAGLLASNDHVLQLDAGDEVPVMDIDALDEWIATEDVGAFEYDQEYGSVGLRIARFYDRRRYRWEGRVHEVARTTVRTDAAAAPTIRCDATQLRVRHHKENKTRHYLAGLALQALECPQNPRWWHYLGRELFYEHWYESAIAALEKHAAAEDAWPAERSQSLCFVGECCEALGRVPEAQEAYRRAGALDPTRREPLLKLAAASCLRGEFEVTVQCAKQALAIPRTSAYPELEANYTWIPHSLLYWSLFWLGRKDEARIHWEAYRSLVPEESMARAHARLFPPPTEGPGRS